MICLVAGAYGFLGSRIASSLVEQGHQLILGSSRSREQPEWLRSARVRVLDYEDPASLQSSLEEVDVVIHCAGMNAMDCSADPARALLVNGVNTAKLVRSARDMQVKKFIYLSTAHVYRSPLEGVIDDKTPTENLHPYATSHLAGENALLSEIHTSTLDGCVLRLTNCFGKPMSSEANCWMLLVNDLCRQAVTARTLEMKSNGSQLRDFIGLTRVCNDIRMLIDSKNLSSCGAEGVVNIATGRSFTLLDMAELIRERCQILFHYKPDLVINDADETNYGSHLEIRPSRCITTFANEDDQGAEIDKLLLFCREYFAA